MFCQNTSKYVRDHDIVEFVNVRTKITIKGKATYSQILSMIPAEITTRINYDRSHLEYVI
jgi:hypothetical protein